jgi:hypothetical protein
LISSNTVIVEDLITARSKQTYLCAIGSAAEGLQTKSSPSAHTS